MAALPDFANLRQLAEEARRRVEPGAWGYIAGGAEDERTLSGNEAAYDAWRLLPRVLTGVEDADTATTVLGTRISLPAFAAPTAYHQLCHKEGEVATAQGAANAGTLFVQSTLSNRALEDVAAGSAGPKWMQVYVFRDRDATADLVARAARAGYGAIVLTVDLPVSGRRERDLGTGFRMPEGLGLGNFERTLGSGWTPHEIVAKQIDPSLTWEDLSWLRDQADLPLVIKGVLAADDAERAIEAGADAIVVSNHGGRQLDACVAGVEALPDVVEAVEDRIEVYVDGGVRRGTDVLKALALGARAVLVGRPVLWGLAVGGPEGVAEVFGRLRDEVIVSMQLLGARSPAEVGPHHVVPAVP